MAIAVGQITIVDYNDAVTLTGFITANLSKTQRYSADTGTFTPDWGESSLVLTPSLFTLGSGVDKITDSSVQSVSWQRKPSDQTTFSALTSGEAVSGSKNHILTVSQNKLTGSINAIEYLCTILFTDPISGLNLTHKMSINLSKVIDGNNIAVAAIRAPLGIVFKNSAPNSLTAVAELYRGATLDTTLLGYQWFQYKAGNADEGAGAGWDLLPGQTAATLTVTPAMVNSLQQFKVKITDNDPSSPTNGNSFYDAIAFTDMTDPISVHMESSGGTIFKNGIGSSTLKCRMFRDNQELDPDGTEHTYSWTVLDKDENARNFADGTAVKVGKTIDIGSSDLYIKSIFCCTID